MIMPRILSSFLSMFVEFYSLSFATITLICSFLIYKITPSTFVESFLLSSLIINIGVRGLFAFVGNWFQVFSRDIAIKYGWEPKNTYQKEIAAGDGALGCLGLLSYWFRGDFWTATLLATSLCWVLSEIANISSILRGKKDPSKKLKADYNVSFPIFLGMHIDLLMVGLMLASLVYWKLKI